MHARSRLRNRFRPSVRPKKRLQAGQPRHLETSHSRHCALVHARGPSRFAPFTNENTKGVEPIAWKRKTILKKGNDRFDLHQVHKRPNEIMITVCWVSIHEYTLVSQVDSASAFVATSSLRIHNTIL